ncbi:hypothetical protein EJ913_21260 [Azospirillum doebereinerae]|uniref:Uncharacterized protein n=1 Tax=Azospirillum doebereinerae TaxID=92933 RepID=A0A3S0VGB1_9PROT|nr:hypothetical protein EJ913_21260 [Azospirillum doebereinerae]
MRERGWGEGGKPLFFAFGEYPSSQPFSRKGRRAFSSENPLALRPIPAIVSTPSKRKRTGRWRGW